jgi:hypothetical protein
VPDDSQHDYVQACQPEGLLQYALLALLSGRRRWKKNRIDF